MNEIDDTDLKLLALLQNDARQSNLALAQQLGISAPTCLRRIKRLQDEGWIERQVAILNVNQLGPLLGHGLNAIVEITLDRQGDEHQQAFEARIQTEAAVQQCWRVSPGPDFVLMVQTKDMPDYLTLSQRLFTQAANVRNVKTFFSLHRAKFTTQIPLTRWADTATSP